MGVLRKYVHNRARSEGSIVKGYGTEEVIEFCVDFIPDLNPIGVPQSRHEGRLRGKGTLGKKAIYVGTGIHSLEHITQFYISPAWWLHISSNTRICYARNTRRNLKIGLLENTRRLSAVGCKHVSLMTTQLETSYTCWPVNHLRLY